MPKQDQKRQYANRVIDWIEQGNLQVPEDAYFAVHSSEDGCWLEMKYGRDKKDKPQVSVTIS